MRKVLSILLCAAVTFLSVGCGAGYKLKEEDAVDIFGCAAFRLDEKMTGTQVTDLYLKEREKGKSSGYTPVILALDRRVRETVEINVSDYGTPEEFRKETLSDTEGGKELLDEWFAQLKEEYSGYGGVSFESSPFTENDETLDMLVKAKAPNVSNNLWSVDDCGNMMIDGEGVYLVRVPTANPWEIIAWLPFCGWNECPNADDMVKICRHWYESYGATPAFITGDMMMFWLDKPIRDKQTARDISHQHAAFCSEFLWMGGLEPQTADIMTSKIWSFWWD